MQILLCKPDPGRLDRNLPSRANRLDTSFKFFGQAPIEFYHYYANWWQTVASIREKPLPILDRAWMLTSIPATSLSTIIDRENRFESLDIFLCFFFFFFCSKQFQISIELDFYFRDERIDLVESGRYRY